MAIQMFAVILCAKSVKKALKKSNQFNNRFVRYDLPCVGEGEG